MTTTKKYIPKLRFTGFEGEWELHKLGDITKWESGGTPSKNEPSYWGGDIPWISASSMRGYFFSESKLMITELGLSNGSKLAKKGTILLLVRGSMLYNKIPVGITGKDVAFNQDVKSIAIRSKTITVFLLQWFFAKQNLLLNTVVGTGIGAGKLDTQDLKNLCVNISTLPEQQKIASFLSAVDKKIQQLTRKKELLEQYKRGVMQKIFSREIRFKDENGKDYPGWEETRGKNLFRSHSNKSHDGDLPILAATQDKGMVYRDTIGIEIKSTDESVKSYKVVEPGDFVISLRSFQGGIEYSELKGICSPAYIILKPKIKIDEQFFKLYFKKEDYVTRLSKIVVGIRDGKQISYDAFSGLKLQVPSVKEQKLISDFLNILQEKINLVITKLERTQTFKKGLLQQMFV